MTNPNTLTHQPCPCGKSSDACTYFLDTKNAKCHSCGEKHRNVEPPTTNTTAQPIPRSASSTKFSAPSGEYRDWPERALSRDTLKAYRVTLGGEDAKYVAKYARFDTEGNHVGNKVRLKHQIGQPENKGFIYEGEFSKMAPFGMNAFEKGSAKYLTIVEGQDDAMAAYEMMGSKYPVISVDSAATASEEIKRHFEWVNSFPTVVLCFDNDDPGRAAARAVAGLGFELGKVKIMTPRKHKDANDYKKARDTEQFMREWWSAPTYKPDGLKLGSDMWEEIIDRKEHFTAPYPFEGLNRLTYGLRLSEMIVVTADTGVGKTSILKTIEHSLLTNPDVVEKNYGVGFLHLEEPNGDTALGLLSIHNSVPYHIPGVDRPKDDLRRAYEELLDNNRVVIWDHFGSNSVDAVVAKIRHMAALGCKYIVLDHLSIVVSDQAGDERKQLDEIATKIKTLAMELDLCVIAVIHTNRQGQIRGTAGVEQLANIVMRLERNKTDPNEWRRNVTKVTVEKNRFTGYTGPACYLWYNKETGRLTELDQEQMDLFDGGGALNDEPF